jgi:hypothetical protein
MALSWAPPGVAAVVISSEVSNVSVTVYRDPNRGAGAMDRAWPGGYALISETRTLRIPDGESVIRFEGVAEGMLPESAIVSGLPKGVREKNRDARLISPAGLVDAYLKRRVTLRRTNRQTGKTVEQDAIIQAGPNGGVILQTAEGVEALGCSGLPERMLYGGIPDDLSAKPTLSVLTTSDREVTVTVQLSYLAQGFDWSASYVAEMAGEGGKLGLFAWLTLANGGTQNFRDADLQVVAGQPNRENADKRPNGSSGELRLECWPMDTTSTHARIGMYAYPPPPPPPPAPEMAGLEDIVVTAQRRMESVMRAPVAVTAIQEDLGDLKLYRVPMRVTVAAQGQKQVAMINQPDARFDRVYTANANEGGEQPRSMSIVLRSKNVKEKGLGVPLPAGGLALFEPVEGRSLLVGEDDMADRAIGEEIEIHVGDSPDVRWSLKSVSRSERRQRWRVTVSNARDVPVKAELIIPYELANKPKGVERGKGGWLLKAEVAAQGTAELSYEIKLGRD